MFRPSSFIDAIAQALVDGVGTSVSMNSAFQGREL